MRRVALAQRLEHPHVNQQPEAASHKEGRHQRGPEREPQLGHNLQRHVGANHEDRAMRKIDHAQHAEYQGEAEREQCVDATQRQGVDDLLFKHDGEAMRSRRTANSSLRDRHSADERPTLGQCCFQAITSR